MLKTIYDLRQEFRHYANPDDLISRYTKQNRLIRLTKGWYETDPDAEPIQFCSLFWQPSYLSFQSALAWYGMIPERVENITCATTHARKKKVYDCPFGIFTYSDIPRTVFAYGLKYNTDYQVPFLIATKEKALCDLIYKQRKIPNQKEMREFLLDDLRLELEDLIGLDLKLINQLAPLYHSTNIQLFRKVLSKWIQH
ncbi:type IV toxin-antitoxin system AbiEi family antitoxin domain-containing protein [Ileibacterium valens]|uniref:type IV toxin-antitoxin system AbiEi family antitoxin domain-containing protein n=1 Tax=Ileibacterium valens TaxID=1862668 RepID=UPI00235585BB|nr:hypothetical protein [Ileibacterium valens]